MKIEQLDGEFYIYDTNKKEAISRRESSVDCIKNGPVAVKCTGIIHKITGGELCKMVNYPNFSVLKPKKKSFIDKLKQKLNI